MHFRLIIFVQIVNNAMTSATTDDIELRICTDLSPVQDDIPLELIELYVQW